MHWHDWHTVTERLQGRAYALTRGQPYKVSLDPTTPTGCCDFTNKQILINPDLFSDVFVRRGLSGQSLDQANFLVSRAITGHESLHVLYSDPGVVLEAANESPVLKTVLNLLEDARIEAIGSATSHLSRTLFGFVNRIAASELRPFMDASLSDTGSILDLLLRWRLRASIPKLDLAGESLWKQVRLLSERALRAQTCSDVLGLAREIVRLAGLDRTQDLPMSDTMRRMQSSMAGTRASEPMRNPLARESETESTDQNGQYVCNDADESGGNSTDASGQERSAGDTSGDRDRATAGGDSRVPDGHNDTPETPHDNTDDDVDLEKLVEDTAAQSSEDLGELVPEPEASTVARSVPFRGRVYSDVYASPYIRYLPSAVPIAAELTRELKAEGPRAVSGPSDSPGRFKTRYYARDSSRPFAAQRYQGLTIPKMALSLVIDRSGSMQDVVDELKVMSTAIAMASETLHIPLSIWALEGQVHIKHFDEHGPQVLAKIAGITADTLTRVMPTIKDAEEELRKRPESLKQIVMIHDGMPSDRADFIAWREGLRGIGLFCMFILKDEDYDSYRENPQPLRESMDSLVGPRNYAIAAITDTAKHWCSFVRNTRNRHALQV